MFNAFMSFLCFLKIYCILVCQYHQLCMTIPLHCLNSRWSCHVYTFINKNGPNSSYCDMCGTRKKQLKNHLRLMEPLICNLEVLLQALLLRFLIRLKVIKLHKHVVSFLHLFAQMFHKKFTDLCDNEEEYKDKMSM